MEVWGASGENCTSHGGLGGYATGKMVLTLNRSIYICNGQAGYLFLGPYSEIHIAYNGGGFGQRIGGGCSHIATTNRGELYNYEKYQQEVLLVAGGGGGSDWDSGSGGHGGGIKGDDYNITEHVSGSGLGGTQTSGGIGYQNGSFGRGGAAYTGGTDGGGGGGGGWYGGGGATESSSSGGGGSGHINTSIITNGFMEKGIRWGNGQTKITWIPVL